MSIRNDLGKNWSGGVKFIAFVMFSFSITFKFSSSRNRHRCLQRGAVPYLNPRLSYDYQSNLPKSCNGLYLTVMIVLMMTMMMMKMMLMMMISYSTCPMTVTEQRQALISLL